VGFMGTLQAGQGRRLRRRNLADQGASIVVTSPSKTAPQPCQGLTTTKITATSMNKTGSSLNQRNHT